MNYVTAIATPQFDSASIQRIKSLDYLRGLLAVSIMVYHYASWSGLKLDAGTVLGRLGIYAVSTFFILSGLSLGLAYRGRLQSWADFCIFLIKRVFRIFPLFWLAVSLAIGLQVTYSLKTGQSFDFEGWRIFLNYSLLFGFINPSAYLTTGAWSIGNEMVFYATFPLLLILFEKCRSMFFVVLLITVALGAYFAFVLLDTGTSLAQQWHLYINPFNQILLFVVGISLTHLPLTVSAGSQRQGAFILILAVAAFVLVPATGDQIVLVTGLPRFIFIGLCVMFVLGAYMTHLNLRFGEKFLSFIGESSYSIYLLHPIIGTVVVSAAKRAGFSSVFGYFVAVPITLLVALVTYRWLEIPMMNLAKIWSRSIKKVYG